MKKRRSEVLWTIGKYQIESGGSFFKETSFFGCTTAQHDVCMKAREALCSRPTCRVDVRTLIGEENIPPTLTAGLSNDEYLKAKEKEDRLVHQILAKKLRKCKPFIIEHALLTKDQADDLRFNKKIP